MPPFTEETPEGGLAILTERVAPALLGIAGLVALGFSLLVLDYGYGMDQAIYSVIADTLLLMVLIWSFHLQYEQPPSFYLKAPTLLYVFIFIALRALRFEPQFVVLAGLVAVLGWILMVFYVAYGDPAFTATAEGRVPDPELLTRDYVLLPCAEIWPDAVHPETGRTLAAHAEEHRSVE